MQFEYGKEDEGGDDSAAESKGLDKAEQAKISQAIEMLKPLAQKEGCSVSDLVAKYEEPAAGESDEAGEDDDKVNVIVARMKSKQEV